MDLRKFVFFQQALQRKQWIQRVILLVPLLAFIAFSYLADPVKHGLQVCAFHRLTGLSCPTCGLSRSFHAFLHGKLYLSFHFHLMGPLIMSGLIVLFIVWIMELGAGKILHLGIPVKYWRAPAIAFFLIWAVYWLVRLLTELL